MLIGLVVAFKKLRVTIGLLDRNLSRQASCQPVAVSSEAADNSVYVHNLIVLICVVIITRIAKIIVYGDSIDFLNHVALIHFVRECLC